MHRPLRHLTALVTRRPVHLTLFATARCNARCPFCFNQAVRDEGQEAGELSTDELRQVAGSMGPLLWVLFSGGEPTLREDLVELAGLFHDRNRAAFLTIPSNGLRPELIAEQAGAVARRCRESVVVVKLSMDGLGAEHDALRRTPGGFDRLMQTYHRLAALTERHPNLELGINTLFCAENQWRLEPLVAFVRGLSRVRAHTLTLVRSTPGVDRLAGVDLDQYRRVGQALESKRHHAFPGGRLKAAQDRLQRRLIHRTMQRRGRQLPCRAGRLSLVLSERGELHPCEGRRDLSLGNVRQVGYQVPALLRGARAAAVLGQVADSGCHCSNECNFLINILFNPRLHPGLLLEYARQRLGRSGSSEAQRGSDEGRLTTQPFPAASNERRWTT
jgi:MoaA/NifB/PqqE/SkfB family radical SAM enzyme